MTDTAWIDEFDSYEAPLASNNRPYLRTVGVALVGFAGVASAAVVVAWAGGWMGHGNGNGAATSARSDVSRPLDPLSADDMLDEKILAARAAQLSADADTVTDIENFRPSGAIAYTPGWLFDPTPQIAWPSVAVAALPSGPAAMPAPVQRIETLRAVPMPQANPLLAQRGQGIPLAMLDPDTQIAAVPMPLRNPLLQGREQLAALPPMDQQPAPATVEPTPDQKKDVALPGPGDRYAIYDIKAQVVYMPSGERLEAHSGYGDMFDDIRHVAVPMRGPTPPNIYDLTMRESRFHGVEALRMKPVGDSKMYGRNGFLTHPYMMGSRGDSNGCVSFKDYDTFLAAYKKGEVTRLIVVASLANPPPSTANPLLSWLAGNAGTTR